MTHRTLLCATLVALSFAAPLRAQTQQQIDWCSSPTATDAQTIEGCLAMIQSGRYSGKSLSSVYDDLGFAYEDLKDYEKALQYYGTAISLNPQNGQALYNRGNVYFTKGQYDQALSDYTQSIAVRPNYAQAFNNRGNTYRHQGDFTKALADFNQAIVLNPNYGLALKNRGETKLANGDTAGGNADLARARQLDPSLFK